MVQYKSIVALLVLCLVCRNECTPLTNEVAEARGIGSTLWGWITYPFTWWSSGSTDIPAEEDHITSPALAQDIDVAVHNVTVWCNEQTCTTRRCDRAGCQNTTCSIYDTDLNGQCRLYNTATPDPDRGTDGPASDRPTTAAAATEQHPSSSEHGDEKPLELEAVLSSTVTEVRDNDTKQ